MQRFSLALLQNRTRSRDRTVDAIAAIGRIAKSELSNRRDSIAITYVTYLDWSAKTSHR